MQVFLWVFAILVFLAGGSIFDAAQSAIHEIEAFILFVIGAVLVAGAGVVREISLLREKLVDMAGNTAEMIKLLRERGPTQSPSFNAEVAARRLPRSDRLEEEEPPPSMTRAPGYSSKD